MFLHISHHCKITFIKTASSSWVSPLLFPSFFSESSVSVLPIPPIYNLRLFSILTDRKFTGLPVSSSSSYLWTLILPQGVLSSFGRRLLVQGFFFFALQGRPHVGRQLLPPLPNSSRLKRKTIKLRISNMIYIFSNIL